jgi:DNA-binding NarL/FixJ family response regulator
MSTTLAPSSLASAQIPIPRNCFRCGAEFRTVDQKRVCPTCRAPKVRQPVALNREPTFRDKQVIELVRQAKLNKEIAHELHLTEGTIKEYLNRIFRKVGVTNRTELAVWAERQIHERTRT